MKLHLPKLLLSALLAVVSLSFASETVLMNDMTPSPGNYYGDSYQIEDKNIRFNGNWQPQSFTDEDGYQCWNEINWSSTNSNQEWSLSGNGVFGIINDSMNVDNVGLLVSGPGTYTIESGVDLRGIYLSIYGGAQVLIEGRVSGVIAELEVGDGGTLDLSKATIAASHVCWGVNNGGTLRVNDLSITPNTCLQVESYVDGKEIVYLDGNLKLKGTSFNISKETKYDDYTDPVVNKLGYIEVHGNQTTISVSGTITIGGRTTILYYGNGADYDENGNWTEPYGNPDPETPLFICSSINEDGLKLLEAYAVKDVYDEEADMDYFWYKPLLDADTFYYAVTGNDNLVYVYLGDGFVTAGPDENDIVVNEGQEIVLGGGAAVPSDENLVWINGGTADASGLSDELLSNEIILSQEGGTLKTDSDQTMTLVGNGSVNYSIVSASAGEASAKLEIGRVGTSDILKLSGEKYESAEINVNAGTVVIGADTTVGFGGGASFVNLAENTRLSNEGTIVADIASETGSTIMNLGSITGDVELVKDASLTNNAGGEISGAVTAAGKLTNYGTITGSIESSDELTNNGTIQGKLTASGEVKGSGSFNETVLTSTALLHVGNSPGYQQHNSLTLERGATLSFSVDGVTQATASNHGANTHSFLKADTLTINAGAGTVAVNVEVTMGIVATGSEPVSLTLMEVGTTNATGADFTLNLKDDAGLLEEGTTLTFDAATGELVLNATVSKAALAALMDSNSANVANTMWASANAVHEFARTAENQFLVGMPGQTTFWGAGVGSFMDVSGDQGFTSNFGGYAVGMQHAFTETFRAGLAFGQMFGDFKSEDKQLKVDLQSLMPALTAQYVTPLSKTSSLSVSGHIAYGVVENEADTYQVGTTGKAEWDDEVLNIGVRVSWNSALTEHTTVSLYTGLTYQQVEQDSFTEEFTGGEREYKSGSMSSLSLPLGVTLRGIYQMEGTNVFAPELTLAYIGDIARDNPEVKTSVYGFDRTGKGTNIGRSAFMLQAGANWMFDSTWSLGAFYSLEARSKQVNQSVNAALRHSF